jgi:hypothetical protein
MALPLDSIATIFIFLIGLPAILLQTLAAEVRHTVLKDRTAVVFFTITPIVVASMLVALGVYLTEPDGPLGPGMTTERAEKIWLAILTMLLGVCGGAALLLTDRWRRTSVVKRLRRAAARGIAAYGRPSEGALSTLVELGMQSRGGDDKTLIVVALHLLMTETQAHESYDGAQLEELIKGLEDVMVSGPFRASAPNFKVGAELLEHLVWESRDRDESDDHKMALQLASILGREALRFEQPHDQIKFVEILAFAGEGKNIGYAMWASQAMLELGGQAIESGRILVAMMALSKLESLVYAHSPVSGELAFDFVGLIAHFYAQRETGRDYGKQFLDASLFAEPLPEVIRQARGACIQSARFRTGDYLDRMLADMESAAQAAAVTTDA